MKSPDSDSRPDPARLEELFHAAAGLSAGEQAGFLERACSEDAGLAHALGSLLAAGRAAATAWERSALELEARHCALEARPAHPGELFGPYRILRRVAAGGMSFVYEAQRDDAEFHKRVAIKFLQLGIDNEAGVERFRRERQILAQFEHPYVARLLDGGTTGDGVPYLVMEYVDGLPIDRFAAERRLGRAARLKLFLQVCEAVAYAHHNLVVHRDLKPGNILVTAEGVPKLLDFGIARLLTDGQATTVRALTPEYASPEQVLGRNLSTATDVYSLGVLLFVLLAERLPYRADASRPAELVRAICEQEPAWEPRGPIQGDLESILDQALRKEPSRRYSSVEQLAADIGRYLEGRPVSARPATVFYRARKFLVRRALLLTALAAILIAVLAGVGSTVIQSRRAERRFNEVRTLAHSLLFEVYDAISALPGSLAPRRLVASRAQQYLDRLARDAGQDSALARELAESYLRLGDVRGLPYAPNMGDTAGALESYRKAQALLEQENARDPGNAAILERLWQVYVRLGRVLNRQNHTQTASPVLERAVAVAELLCAHDPRNPAYRQILLRSYGFLGEAQQLTALQNGSLAGLQEALATSRKSLDYFRIGYALWALGDQTGDISYYRQALESQLKGMVAVRRQAEAHPGQPDRTLADTLLTVAGSRRKCGDLAGARRDNQEALEIFRRLAGADPNNAEARRDLGNVYEELAQILGEEGRRREALEAHRKALGIYEEITREDPTSSEDARYVAEVRARLAALEGGR